MSALLTQTAHTSLRSLLQIQRDLEDHYGAYTGLSVHDFLSVSQEKLHDYGRMEVVQYDDHPDIDLRLLFDRDILSAWQTNQTPRDPKPVSVVVEEISHFVYLSFNHQRGRNVTRLEMELQSELDRIWIAFHGSIQVTKDTATELLKSFLFTPYQDPVYEKAREIARSLLKNVVGLDPARWGASEFDTLRRFYHSDLGEKIHLARARRH